MEMTESAPNVTAQEQEVSRRHWWTNSRVHVISFGFVFLNTILIAVVLGVLTQHQRSMSSTSGEGTEVAMTLRERFPGRFLFIEEKEKLADTIRTVNGSALPVTNSPCVNEDKSICEGEPWVSIITGPPIINACCEMHEFIEDFPDTLVDIYNINRTITTYRTGEDRVAKQFYTRFSCKRVPDCKCKCKCQLISSMVSAVYDNKKNQEQVGRFYVENICVCMNN